MSTVGRSPGGFVGNRNFLSHFSVVLVLCVALLRCFKGHPWVLLLCTVSGYFLLTLRSRVTWWTMALVCLSTVLIFLLQVKSFGRLWGGSTAGTDRVWADPRIVRLCVLFTAVGGEMAGFTPSWVDWKSSRPYLETAENLTNIDTGSGASRVRQWHVVNQLGFKDWLVGAGSGQWPALSEQLRQ
jgi:hypothetical protein